MSTDEHLRSRLLGKLYDAAAEPGEWPSFLHLLTDATGGDKAALLLHDVAQARHSISLHWGVHPEAIQRYSEHYGPLDTWMQRAHSMAGEGWLASSEEVIQKDDLLRTEFYNDYLRRLVDIAHAAWSIPTVNNRTICCLGVYRNLEKGPFDRKELRLLGFLAPHVKNAVKLHFRMAALRGHSENLQIALDAFAVGLVLVGPKTQIVAMNRKASQVIAENDGLSTLRGQLRAGCGDETTRLECLLFQAVATSEGRGFESAGAMLISRRNREPLHLLVTPVRRLGVDESNSVRAVVFLSDREQRLRPPQELLRSLYQLTPAECRVAILLADGHSPKAIAEMIGIGRNTMKTHLASIYQKTSTSRQSQLVRLLLQFPLA